jgi:hypothetical protein
MRFLMRFAVTLLIALHLGAQPNDTSLLGRIEDNRYIAPHGNYSITLPVQIDLQGTVSDTPEVVTFQDDFRIHASVACFKMESPHDREIQTRGRRDFLIWFFRQQVQTQFQLRFPGSKIDEARYMPEVLEGTLIVFNSLPNGTMFTKPAGLTHSSEKQAIAKRGNLLFLNKRSLYVVSIELAELLSQDENTASADREEDHTRLRKELLDLVGRITFSSS